MADDADRELRCLVKGDHTTFVITLPVNNDVEGLRNLIQQKRNSRQRCRRFSALEGGLFQKSSLKFQLTLPDAATIWQVNIDLDNLEKDSLHTLNLENALCGGALKLTGWEPTSNYWLYPAPERHLHISVEHPCPTAGGSSEQRMKRTADTLEHNTRKRQKTDVTKEILRHWKPSSVTLPHTNELVRFLDRPLHERAKIPLLQQQFDGLVSNTTELGNWTTKEDIEMLFRPSEYESADPLFALFYTPTVHEPPGDNATENVFISFWDMNIRFIVEGLVPRGVGIRDSNCYPSTCAKRPDFGFIISQVCPFRGEEKSATNVEDSKAELRDKLTWIYDPAPYFLGTAVTLVAICRPHPGSQTPVLLDLLTVDLRLRSGRIKNLIRIVNLSSLIIPITAAIGLRIFPGFVPLKREDKTVEMCGTNIKKTYKGALRYTSIGRLKLIYNLLKEKNVPNVDNLALSFTDDIRGAVAFLVPRGINIEPRNMREMLEAVGWEPEGK